MSDPTITLWLDCETTGFDPNRHGMIEIAAIAECVGVRVTHTFETLIIDEQPPDWNLDTVEFHHEHGLLAKWREDANARRMTTREAESQLIMLLQNTNGGYFVKRESVLLAGLSPHALDRPFIARYMPRLDALLHHRHLDCSVIEGLFERASDGKWQRPKVAHHALADITLTRARYKLMEEILRGRLTNADKESFLKQASDRSQHSEEQSS